MMKSPEQRAKEKEKRKEREEREKERKEREKREEKKEKKGEVFKEQREEDNNLLTLEVKMLIEEYLRKNDFYNPQLIKKTDINYELFFKVIGGKSCIKDEIRRKFWMMTDSKNKPHPMEPSSICAHFDEKQREYYNEGYIDRTELLYDMDYYHDTCHGQRGFERNEERLCNRLIEFYETNYTD